MTLQSSSLGTVLATASGLTLYVLKSDTPGTGGTTPVSTCGSGCTGSWPPFTAMPATVPAGLSVSDFGSFNRGGGVMQTTYKGWPLYLFVGDTSPGNVTGDGLGGVWFAVKIPFTPP
ncbi:MAG: hypothetical protein HY898_12925 [Deltaproteobacteria bacterium]|nr:hypothetical protein [Deltaproteobacteria bacterium]